MTSKNLSGIEPGQRRLNGPGDIELQLDATITAPDTGWIAVLYDLAPDGTSEAITGGWLRATLRTVNEERSIPGAPGDANLNTVQSSSRLLLPVLSS
jgi:predicted acyl esterase